MNSPLLLGLAVAALGLSLVPGITLGQEREPAPMKGAPALEKRVAELERQLATLVKELQDLRRELRLKPPPTVIPVNELDPTDCAHVIKEVYSDRRVVTVEALPRMKCVAVQADAKTTQEIKALLSNMERAARESAKEPGKVIVGNIKTDPKVLEEAIRAFKKEREATAKHERAKREGTWLMVSWEENGLTIPPYEVRKWKMVIKGDECMVTREGTEISRGRYGIDVTHSPYHEDYVVANKNNTTTMYLGIYSLEGNRLTCCYAERSRGRPVEFDNGPGKALIVWQRARP
jgi:uncharacterized protein (TIGR03067 family)